MSRIIVNETSYFGSGCRSSLAGEISRRGFKKALVVTDKDLIKFGIADKVLALLNEVSFPYTVFSDVKANPTIKNCNDGISLYKETGADFIIAIGGGSVIDTAKAIGIVTNNPDFADLTKLEGVADTKNKSVPIIAFATTAGTAAEVTINYVITDENARKKMVCVDPNSIPVLAYVDAELMFTMPKSLTAATGMDALTHAIESFITPGAWEMTDMMEIKSIELIAKHLKNAVENGEDKVAREGMALAQYIAGMGFSNVGLGIVHSMAHPLGAIYDIAHGVANAILLPTVMEYNIDSNSKPKYRLIAQAMGVNTENMSDEKAAYSALQAVKDLSASIGIPKNLTVVGVKVEDLDRLSVDAFNDPCTGGNPRPTSVADIKELYKKAL